MRRFGAVARKELLQLRRDRMTLGMMVGIPVMQLLLFGYAINTDVRHMPTVVYDQDHSAESRDLVRRLEATGFYDHRRRDARLRRDRARAALGPGRASRWSCRRASASACAPAAARQVQLVVDGSDPQTVASATNTAASLSAARSLELLSERLARSALRIAGRADLARADDLVQPRAQDRDLRRARPDRA